MMESQFHIIITLAVIFGFYMAWGIGANDVANAMGTSVGSGALTLTRAVILAAIMEFAGAFLVGPHVSETIRQNIIPPEVFAGQPMLLALGMIAALLAAGAWLQLASYCGWPFSRPPPLPAARRIPPFMVFAVMATMLLVLAFKGLKPFWKDNFGVDPFDT